MFRKTKTLFTSRATPHLIMALSLLILFLLPCSVQGVPLLLGLINSRLFSLNILVRSGTNMFWDRIRN